MWQCGHGRKRRELVGVKEKAAKTGATHDRGERGEGVTGKVDILEPFHVREKSVPTGEQQWHADQNYGYECTINTLTLWGCHVFDCRQGEELSTYDSCSICMQI